MRRTEAWWVCHACNRPVAKVGKKGVKQLTLEHNKEKGCSGGSRIQQVEQRKDYIQHVLPVHEG